MLPLQQLVACACAASEVVRDADRTRQQIPAVGRTVDTVAGRPACDEARPAADRSQPQESADEVRGAGETTAATDVGRTTGQSRPRPRRWIRPQEGVCDHFVDSLLQECGAVWWGRVVSK